jgi:hypothetical protein
VGGAWGGGWSLGQWVEPSAPGHLAQFPQDPESLFFFRCPRVDNNLIVPWVHLATK